MPKSKKPVESAAELIPDHPTVSSVREAAKDCQACDLYKRGTQTVFGEGPARARVMIVGEPVIWSARPPSWIGGLQRRYSRTCLTSPRLRIAIAVAVPVQTALLRRQTPLRPESSSACCHPLQPCEPRTRNDGVPLP